MLTKVQLAFGLTLVLLTAIGLTSFKTILALVHLTRVDAAAAQAECDLQRLRGLLAEGATAARDPATRPDLEAAAAAARIALSTIEPLLDEPPEHRRQFAELRGRVRDYFDALLAGQPANPEPARNAIARIIQHEGGRREGVTASVNALFSRVRFIFLAGTALAFAAVGLAMFTIRRDDARRVRAEERLALALEATRDGMWDWNVATGSVYVSPSWRAMFGSDQERITIAQWHALVHPDDLPTLRAATRDHFSGATPYFEQEFRVRVGDDERWILGRGRVVSRDASGRPTRMVGVNTDITDRKRIQAELEQTKESAQKANRAKSEFLAVMSHEIRTPMNGILGMTRLALHTPLTEEQRDYLRTVLQSGEALLTIINDVLDFSKIEAGKLDLEAIEFNLRDLIGETMKTLALRVQQKGLELAHSVDADVPAVVVGDPGRLRQVIVNLVSNATKFTDRGEVVLRVQSDEASDDAVNLLFSVRDTGIGIPPDKVETIFKPFEQVDASTTRRFGGTGLGLTVCQRLVGLMGGRIWVESTLGLGSTFYFTAKLRRGQQPDRSRAADRLTHLAGVPALVVDDNATSGRILTGVLRDWGLEPSRVETAVGALEGLRTAREAGRPFGLIFVDAGMPEANLDAWLTALDAQEGTAKPPIVLLLPLDRARDLERWRGLGIHAGLIKPVLQSDLFRALEQLKSAGGPRAPGPPPPPSDHRAPKPLAVLIAEDNLVNQRLAAKLVERMGHSVTLAANGREAFDAWQAGGIDVILMDVQMPEVDGFEATRRIRAAENGGGRRTPIIALTAHTLEGDKDRCLAAGMDGYVTKPVRTDELADAIRLAGSIK
jgi:PAS domain S-box-containing protein